MKIDHAITNQIPIRFEEKMVKVPFSTCWYWTGTIGSSGYGHAKTQNSRKNNGVHRIVYEFIHGPIPDGMEVDHTCNTRTCINPSHLEVVTHKENMKRIFERRKADKTT